MCGGEGGGGLHSARNEDQRGVCVCDREEEDVDSSLHRMKIRGECVIGRGEVDCTPNRMKIRGECV